MQALVFYAVYPLICLIAWLPFRVLYAVSDFLYWVLRLSGYRQDVIAQNLRNAFPEKTDTELTRLRAGYNHYLCDLILETLKTLNMSETEARQRCLFHTTPWLKKLAHENRSIIVLMGHYGNWEWAGPGFTLQRLYELNVVYKPLSNPYFEKMLVKTRTKFGTRITKVNDTLRGMVALRNQLTATALIADQTPSPDNAYWMTFLNQDTAVFTGFEKLARKFNYPVVYMQVRRTARGYYEVHPILLFENPKDTAENEICRVFMQTLEKDICHEPTTWLWSHKRWKHCRTP